MFRLKIETDNAAFEGDSRGVEIARILREVAVEIETGIDRGKVRDINGNLVGEYSGG